MTQKIIDEHGRTCTKCGEYKPLSEYYKRNGSADGYAKQCKSCLKANSKRNRVPLSKRDDRRKADHHILKAQRDNNDGLYVCWIDDYDGGIKKVKERQIEPEVEAERAWRHWLKSKATDEWMEQYYFSLGKPWSNPRISGADKYRLRYRLDPEYNLNERMRRQIRKAKDKSGISEDIRQAIKRGGSSPKVERELGYSIAELMRHIERQFTKGMTMDKLRCGEIHIDHIMPQASFELSDNNEWIACWSLSNLQPLWARDNLRKKDKVSTLI